MSVPMLDLAFFKSFKGADSLLLHGNRAAVQELAVLLEQLASGQDAILELHQSRGVVSHAIELTAIRTEKEGGLVRQGARFVWRNNTKTLESFAAQVRSLAQEDEGHVYLEVPGQEFQVVVSCNEYGSIFERTDA